MNGKNIARMLLVGAVLISMLGLIVNMSITEPASAQPPGVGGGPPGGLHWQLIDENLVYLGGSVGIGIEDPSAPFQVAGSAAMGLTDNIASGENSFVSGGFVDDVFGIFPNTASGSSSFVGGGRSNEASGLSSFVGGGVSNEASGLDSFVGGGAFNEASGDFSFVGGGTFNEASGGGSFVGGGGDNEASGDASFVSGGASNVAGGNASFVGGGAFNEAGGARSFVGGGVSNEASGEGSFVGGGFNNVASGLGSFVAGQGNEASGTSSFVGGGLGNVASGAGSFVGGGEVNEASGLDSFVGGGAGNVANGLHSFVGGGVGNEASGFDSFVGGGLSNVAGGIRSFAAGRRAKANHDGSFVWGGNTNADVLSSADNQMTFRSTGGVRIFTNADLDAGITLAPGGSSWASVSDRNAKENFEHVDPRDILARLAGIPIQTWNYKSQGPEIRHIGPTAQEFHAAFALGEDEMRITTIDADGVALAAIQGLHLLVQERDTEIADLRVENASLHDCLQRLEALVHALAADREKGNQP